MQENKIVDHLFRHQYGKMVSILTRIFGLAHLETIEDAVQDTFVNAMLKWRQQMPENPEAWLTQAAKNRVLDLFRKIKAEGERAEKWTSGPSAIAINELFLDHEIEDSQLRMIFTACHPVLHPKDQIAFALKTIAGFSQKEIASALLLKEETVKKRLVRARKSIIENKLSFEFPPKEEVAVRLHRVLEVLYLIFNEGFHSNRKGLLVRKDLCGEALRLCKMILKKESFRNGAGYSLFALMCIHSARLESKLDAQGEIIDIRKQDRSKWFFPLVALGNEAMIAAVEYEDLSSYFYEAAIAIEHTAARNFEETNWAKIYDHYEKLYQLHPTPFTKINMAVVQLQMNENEKALATLESIDIASLEQRAYLYYATLADYYIAKGDIKKAVESFDEALSKVNNEAEKKYLQNKKVSIQS